MQMHKLSKSGLLIWFTGSSCLIGQLIKNGYKPKFVLGAALSRLALKRNTRFKKKFLITERRMVLVGSA